MLRFRRTANQELDLARVIVCALHFTKGKRTSACRGVIIKRTLQPRPNREERSVDGKSFE